MDRPWIELISSLTRYLNVAIVVESAAASKIARDPDDGPVRSPRADLIVTGDLDLSRSRLIRTSRSIAAAEAMRRVEAQK